MGPFELVDLVGLDTRLSILEYLHRSLGEKYRPCPLLAQYVKAGRLGRKAGKGVYDVLRLLVGRLGGDRRAAVLKVRERRLGQQCAVRAQ